MAREENDVFIELCVETLTGSVFEFEVSSMDTVLSVKAKIQRLEGIPASQQHLIWRSEELDDKRTIQDYGITDGSTLKLMISMRGGPINTRRIPVEDPTWKEITEYMEANREEIWEKLPGGRQVTLLVFRDGDQINFFRLMDRGDGTVAPIAETLSSSPVRSVCITEELEDVDQRLRENNATMQKMRSIRKQMEALTLKKKLPRKRVSCSRQSTSTSLLSVATTASVKSKSQKSTARHPLRLPPIPATGNVGSQINAAAMRPTAAAAAAADASILGIGLVPRLTSPSRDRDSPTPPPVMQLTVGGDGGVLRVETSCSSDSDDLEPRRWNHPSSWSTSLVDSRENLGRSDGRGSSSSVRDGAMAMGILSPASEIPTRRHQLRGGGGGGGASQAAGSSIENLEQLQQTLAKFDPRISVQTRMPRTISNRSNLDAAAGMGFLVRRMKMDNDGDAMRPKASSLSSSSSSSPPPPLSLTRSNRSDTAAAAPSKHLVSLLAPASNGGGGARLKCIVNAASQQPSDAGNFDGQSSWKNGQNRQAQDGAAKKPSHKDVSRNLPNSSQTVPGGLTVLPLEEATDNITTRSATAANKKTNHRRCLVCKRKTGLATSYSCRCGHNFCATHRYAEMHDCNYDYKTEGRRFLERTNPLVTAQKLPEI